MSAPFLGHRKSLVEVPGMRRAVAVVLLFLSPFFVVYAQTDAQRALNSEPESRQVQRMGENMKNPQQRSPGAVDQTISIRQMNGLMDRLEDRLNREARACNFCPEKQDELSELIRQRVGFVNSTSQILGHDRAPFLMNLAGITPSESRWTNIRLALGEASNAVRAHCARFNGPQEQYCRNNGGMRIAGEHENAWATCFQKNNWVEDSSKRRAYEACMSATDPFTKMCEHDRKAGMSCPYFTVLSSDVHELHYYHDRWNTDPNRLPATAVIISNQPAHVTLLEPVIATMPSGPNTGFTLTVRGRLDNALDGEYSGGLNPTTGTISVIAPEVTEGLKGSVELLPAGIEVPITVTLGPLGGSPANGGQLSLQVIGQKVGPSKDGQLITQNISREIRWPAPGTVLMAANSPLSFATQCGCPYSMTIAEFRKRAAARAAAPPAATLASRVILMGSRIQTVLMEPITVSGIQSGKRFHAQLNVDMDLPRGSNSRNDAMELKRGTDVYLKVNDTNQVMFGGHMGQLAIDYVVVSGRQVPLSTPAWPLQFATRDPNSRSRVPIVDVVLPVGDTKWFDVAEQAEVSTAGMAPDQN